MTIRNSLNKSNDYYFFQLVDILKKYPCIIYVKNCVEYKSQKLTLE